MGFFAGVVGELNRMEDRKERREEFMAALLEKRKNAIIPQLLDRMGKSREKAQGRATKMQKAVGFGFTEEAASILEANGQLDTMLVRLDKLEGDPKSRISKAGISRLSETLVETVPPEKVAAAMEYAFDSGYAEDPSSDILIEAVYASTDAELEGVMRKAMDVTSSGQKAAPTFDQFDINVGSLTEADPKNLAEVRKALSERLAPQLGGTVDSETNQVNWTDDKSAGRIIANAEEYYLTQMRQPLASRDPFEVLNEITDKVTNLTGNFNLKEIASFDGLDAPEGVEAPAGTGNTEGASDSATESLLLGDSSEEEEDYFKTGYNQ